MNYEIGDRIKFREDHSKTIYRVMGKGTCLLWVVVADDNYDGNDPELTLFINEYEKKQQAVIRLKEPRSNLPTLVTILHEDEDHDIWREDVMIEIIRAYKVDRYGKNNDEPLDGDEIDDLIEHMKTSLNRHQGNE